MLREPNRLMETASTQKANQKQRIDDPTYFRSQADAVRLEKRLQRSIEERQSVFTVAR